MPHPLVENPGIFPLLPQPNSVTHNQQASMARARQFLEINLPCLLMLFRNLTKRTQEVETTDLQTPDSAHGSLSPNLLYKLQMSPLQATVLPEESVCPLLFERNFPL